MVKLPIDSLLKGRSLISKMNCKPVWFNSNKSNYNCLFRLSYLIFFILAHISYTYNNWIRLYMYNGCKDNKTINRLIGYINWQNVSFILAYATVWKKNQYRLEKPLFESHNALPVHVYSFAKKEKRFISTILTLKFIAHSIP